jgi:ABC-type oligopeptide transport system substrate-binding subunit
MQFKSITVIIVLSLVAASLLVSGCTSSTTSTTQGTVSLKATQVTAPQSIGSPYIYTHQNRATNSSCIT